MNVMSKASLFSLVDDASSFFGSATQVLVSGKTRDWGVSEERNNFLNLTQEACQLGVFNILAPRISNTSDKVVDREKLEEHGSYMVSGPFGPVSISRGRDEANAVLVEPGEAGFFAVADCPVAVVRDPQTKRVVCAHAGRDCIIDPMQVKKDHPGRNHPSIIDAVMTGYFPEESRSSLQVFITCGIQAKSFSHSMDHADYGEYNKKLIEHISNHWGDECIVGEDKSRGCISLAGIISRQCEKYGVLPGNVWADDIDTFSDVSDVGGQNVHRLWSHRRWVENGKRGIDGRNGVLVVNRGASE